MAVENNKYRKIFGIAILSIFILFCALITYYIGGPMIRFVDDPQQFRSWVDSHGFIGRLAFVGMVVLQVIVAVIPGEPLEMGAGYAFGAIEGTILCIMGVFIGSLIVFLGVRKFGMKLVELFFSREKIADLKFLKTNKKRVILFFIIFLIPGTPKDILCYFAGLTDMKIEDWVVITLIARLPSVLTSTLSGNYLGTENYITAIIVLGLTAFISIIGVVSYKLICKFHNK